MYDVIADPFINSLGLTVKSGGNVTIKDRKLAESCTFHDKRLPAVIAGFARIDPKYTKVKFPRYTLLDLINHWQQMDHVGRAAFVRFCGYSSKTADPMKFGEQIINLICMYQLDDFFEFVGEANLVAPHKNCRPKGVDWSFSELKKQPQVLREWHERYKLLPVHRQIMAYLIIKMYNGNSSSLWLSPAPKDFLLADVISVLEENYSLEDFGKTFSYYSGW